MTHPLSRLRQQIGEIDQLHKDGMVSDQLHSETRARLERELVEQVLAGPAVAPVTEVPAARSSIGLWSAVGAAVLVIGGAGYWWAGSPGALTASVATSAPGTAATPQAQTPQAPHALGNEQMLAMVEALAGRLKAKPEDAEGWGMLARSYATLGRHAESVPAYAKALALSPRDATLMADYADALALQQDRKLAGAPMEWVKRALALDANQPKALLLAGTEAFDRKDYAQAARYWETAVKSGPPESALAKQAQAGLDDLRQLQGAAPAAPVSLPAAPVSPASPAPVVAAATGARVSGSVSMAPALMAKAQPGDTVFIFARPADGARMPLALLRRQVKDLPMNFELDDTLAMSPQAKLSSVQRVIVSARVSRSGQAQPQPGDLEGASEPVAVGTTGLKLVIERAVP